ncbi:MAG: DUF4412 domain-containing protein [Deltaproteobacteria bacterium]|nr:DUF4412 domain-containing protein [Deltaproteobacteria bacterium]
MKQLTLALTLVGALTGTLTQPAFGGVYYEAQTTMDKGAGSSTVHAWIDDQHARVEFIESDIPMTKKGTYLISRDGGQTLFMVNPSDETYSEWDFSAMINLAEGMSGLVNLEFSDPEVELLEEGDGGEVLGYPTRHYKYRTSYDFRMKILGMKRSNHTVTIQEMWVSQEFSDAGLNAWLRKSGRSSGDSSLDRLIGTEMEKIQGFPLKSEVVTTSVGGKKGKTQTSRSTTNVTLIRKESVKADRFEIPSHYQRVELLPTGGEGEGDENPLGSIFGRRN